MSTHTDPTVMQTHDDYAEALGDLTRALRTVADWIQNSALVAFDDDGHMRHLDHAITIVEVVNRNYADGYLTRLIEAGDRADKAIRQARSHQ